MDSSDSGMQTASKDSHVRLRGTALPTSGQQALDLQGVLSRNEHFDTAANPEHRDLECHENLQTDKNYANGEVGQISEAAGGISSECCTQGTVESGHGSWLVSSGAVDMVAHAGQWPNCLRGRNFSVDRQFPKDSKQMTSPHAELMCPSTVVEPTAKPSVSFHGHSVQPGQSDFAEGEQDDGKSVDRHHLCSTSKCAGARAAAVLTSKAVQYNWEKGAKVVYFRCSMQEGSALSRKKEHAKQHVVGGEAEDLRGINDSNATNHSLPFKARYVLSEGSSGKAHQESTKSLALEGGGCARQSSQDSSKPPEALGACCSELLGQQGEQLQQRNAVTPVSDNSTSNNELEGAGASEDDNQSDLCDDDPSDCAVEPPHTDQADDVADFPDVYAGMDIDLRRERRCLHCCISVREVGLPCGHRNLCWNCFFCQGFWSSHLRQGPPRCLVCGETYQDIYMQRVVRLGAVRRLQRCGCAHRRG